MKTRIPFIDFARAFAILGIAVYHYLLPLGDSKLFGLAISFGGTRIHLFFFLSGYGLGMSSYTTAGDFFRRRFSRVLLPYFMFVGLLFLFNLLVPIYPENGLKDLAAHLFLFKMFDGASIGSFGFHLWFMSTLIQLYLFFPLLHFVLKRLSAGLVFGIALFLSAAYIFYVLKTGHAYDRPWNSFFLAYLWEFALGAVLGMKRNARIFEWRIPVYAVLWIAGLGAMAVFTLKLGQAGRLLNDIPAFVAITAFTLLAYHLLGSLKTFKPVQNFFTGAGALSYEFYLGHYVGFSLLKYLEPITGAEYGFWAVPVLVLFSWFLAKGLHQITRLIKI